MGGDAKRIACAVVLAALCAGTGVGATLVAEAFTTTGQPQADWYWLGGTARAQWEFLSVPPGLDPYLGVEVFVCLPVSSGGAPREIEARLRIRTSAAASAQLWAVRMGCVQVGVGYALYFGQAFVPRRIVGSRLTVELEGAGSLPLGVHAQSVRVVVAGGASGSGLGTPVAGQAGSAGVSDRAGTAVLVRSLPASDSPGSAPFLAPGTYRGTLGWGGPGEVPNGKGLYRVNLRAGEIVSVRVETEAPCTLLILDPEGRKVGEISGRSWLGLEYRADRSGAWQILVLCPNGGPRFSFTLTVGIRT